MRYAVISDVHSNVEALDAVLRACDEARVDRLVCLGDTVGYGAQPNECCDLIRRVADHVILGNHDAAVAGRMDYSYYYDAAREALDHHSRLLDEKNLEWLRGLPYSDRDGDLYFCHGSPVDLEEFEYIFTVNQAESCITKWDELGRATFIGHSHLCKSYAVSMERGYEVITRDFVLRPALRYVISVGSVGQPRDHDPRASYTIYDSESERFEFRRVEYDVNSAAQKIFKDSRLSDTFGSRLFSGM